MTYVRENTRNKMRIGWSIFPSICINNRLQYNSTRWQIRKLLEKYGFHPAKERLRDIAKTRKRVLAKLSEWTLLDIKNYSFYAVCSFVITQFKKWHYFIIDAPVNCQQDKTLGTRVRGFLRKKHKTIIERKFNYTYVRQC